MFKYKLRIDGRSISLRLAETKREHVGDLQWVKIWYKIEVGGFIIISEIVKIYLKSEI